MNHQIYRFVAIALMGALVGAAHAQIQATDQSIANGLSFLTKQQADDGSFSDEGLKPSPTALAVLAFLSSGQTPDVGRYGLTLRRGISYLVGSSNSSGIPVNDAPLVCIALAEAYAVEPVPEQRSRLRTGVQALATQMISDSQDHELQQRVQIILALRSARNIGIRIADNEIQHHIDQILACHNPGGGGFGNRPGAEPSPANIGPAMLVFQFFPPSKVIDELAFPEQSLETLPYAPLYLAVQRALLGTTRRTVIWELLCQRLIAEQNADGGWNTALKGGGERILSTSYALLIQTARGRMLTTFLR